MTNAKFVDVKQHTSFMTSQDSSKNSPLERPKLQKFLADAGLSLAAWVKVGSRKKK